MPRTLKSVIGFVVLGTIVGGCAGRLGRFLLRSLSRGALPRAGSCELAVGVLWGVVALCVHADDVPWWWVVFLLATAWWAVLLSACDLLAYRLPDCLTLPAYPVAVVVVFLMAATGDRAAIGGACVGAGLYAGTYLVVRLCAPDSLGPGDLKLAGSLGACSGALSPWGTVACMGLTSLLTLFMVMWLMMFRRRQDAAHGPAMLAPVWGLLLVS